MVVRTSTNFLADGALFGHRRPRAVDVGDLPRTRGGFMTEHQRRYPTALTGGDPNSGIARSVTAWHGYVAPP